LSAKKSPKEWADGYLNDLVAKACRDCQLEGYDPVFVSFNIRLLNESSSVVGFNPRAGVTPSVGQAVAETMRVAVDQAMEKIPNVTKSPIILPGDKLS